MTNATPEFSQNEFQQLRFLEGRWKGQLPGGGAFYEQYRFLDDTTLRSYRYPDSSFAEPQDSSTVAWADGRITSSWGKYRWTATVLDSSSIRFSPEEGVSNTFTWRRTSPRVLEVHQEWQDESGEPQQATIAMERLDP